MKPINYRPTIFACFIGYVVQALTINFTPLLYIQFQTEYGLSVPQISVLIGVCFTVQLLTDALAAKFSDKMNPRLTVVCANALAAVGIAGLNFLPRLLDPFTGLLIAIILSGAGSGLVEVMISPIVEACPTKRKSAMMSLLHSFYCWGHAAVTLLSGLFFATVGIGSWKTLALLWALIPLTNAILFIFVPIATPDTGKESESGRSFIKTPIFWVLVAIMLCAGASEMAMGQWASTFAELALNDKALGDLFGPFLFAILMGTSRILYAKFSTRISLSKTMLTGGILCLISYLIASLAPTPAISLLGCALCGLAVGVMWPGGLSTASGFLPHGGISMFALLALAGDLGCLSGPTLVGALSEAVGGEIKFSFLFASAFPLLLMAALFYLRIYKKKVSQKSK